MTTSHQNVTHCQYIPAIIPLRQTVLSQNKTIHQERIANSQTRRHISFVMTPPMLNGTFYGTVRGGRSFLCTDSHNVIKVDAFTYMHMHMHELDGCAE